MGPCALTLCVGARVGQRALGAAPQLAGGQRQGAAGARGGGGGGRGGAPRPAPRAACAAWQGLLAGRAAAPLTFTA